MNLDPYRIATEPYYEPLGNEIEVFEAAYAERLPVMLKGPTGCGKTRFVEHMAWRLGKPLITVAAHEDMTAADLAGRYLLEPDRNRLARRPADLAVRYRRDLLSRRNRRGPAGHHRGDPSADRCAADSAAGEAQRDRVRASRLPAHDLLQSRLPERGQGSEGIDQAALRRDRFRLSAAADRKPRSSSRESGTDSDLAGTLVAIAQRSRNLAGPRPRRRRLDPHADPCRATGRAPACRWRPPCSPASCCRSPTITISAKRSAHAIQACLP